MTNDEFMDWRRLVIRAFVLGVAAGVLIGVLCGCSVTVFEGTVDLPYLGKGHMIIDAEPAPWMTQTWAEVRGLAIGTDKAEEVEVQ